MQRRAARPPTFSLVLTVALLWPLSLGAPSARSSPLKGTAPGASDGPSSIAVERAPSGEPCVRQISAGQAHSLALMDDGTVRAWGLNSWGQLGVETPPRFQEAPVVVSGIDGLTSATTAHAVAAGRLWSMALMNDGTVRSWGDGHLGQLGDGSSTSSSTPVLVAGIDGLTPATTAIAIAGGHAHSVALMADGTLRAWGYGDHGALGDGTNLGSSTPVVVSGIDGLTPASMAVDVACGSEFSIALMGDGTLRAWGGGRRGKLGNGSTADSSTPVVVSGIDGLTPATTVAAIAAGDRHALALMGDGTLRAWGLGYYGQIGNGTTGSTNATPLVVSDIDGLTPATRAVGVGAGYQHSLAVMEDGTLRAWGYNLHGELGDGTTTNSSTPVLVSVIDGLLPVTTAAAATGADRHSLALMADGGLRAWGSNVDGLLGLGDRGGLHYVPELNLLSTPCPPPCEFDIDCDDGDVCTDDLCDSADGSCSNPPFPSDWCNDGDPCTDDSCDPLLGCVNAPIPNGPPTADAGGAYLADCNGALTLVPLDGAFSFDPDGDELGYFWVTNCPGAALDDPTSESPMLTLAGPPPCPVACTVTLVVTDSCGLASMPATAVVTVEDTTPPSIEVGASDLTVECDGAGNQAAFQSWLDSHGGAAASDGCSGITWSDDSASLSDECGATGSATVVFTATDDCGLSSSTTATFTIEDTTPPVLVGDPDDDVGLWPPNHAYACFRAADLSPRLADTCGSASWAFSGCTWSDPDGTGLDDQDCVVSPGGDQVCLRAERSGQGPRTYTVFATATDECGLATTSPILVVTVAHDQSPHEDCVKTTGRQKDLPF